MVRTPASGWPPAPDASAGQVAHAARDRLGRAGVGNVADVVAVAADPWLVTVTLTKAAPAAVPVIRETLTPAAVEVVWYEGASEVAGEAGGPGGPPGNDAGPRGSCGVCGAPGPSWRHTTDPPVAGAPVAVAGSWDLCTVCHALVEAGDGAGLRRRMGGLSEGEVELVVRALLARTGR